MDVFKENLRLKPAFCGSFPVVFHGSQCWMGLSNSALYTTLDSRPNEYPFGPSKSETFSHRRKKFYTWPAAKQTMGKAEIRRRCTMAGIKALNCTSQIPEPEIQQEWQVKWQNNQNIWIYFGKIIFIKNCRHCHCPMGQGTASLCTEAGPNWWVHVPWLLPSP